MPFIVATYVYASSQGQRTHSSRTNNITYNYNACGWVCQSPSNNSGLTLFIKDFQIRKTHYNLIRYDHLICYFPLYNSVVGTFCLCEQIFAIDWRREVRLSLFEEGKFAFHCIELCCWHWVDSFLFVCLFPSLSGYFPDMMRTLK